MRFYFIVSLIFSSKVVLSQKELLRVSEMDTLFILDAYPTSKYKLDLCLEFLKNFNS